MATPEKLNLYDRFFNRYRKEIHDRGSQTWHRSQFGYRIDGSDFERQWIEYKIIDRLTGSETIERDYLT